MGKKKDKKHAATGDLETEVKRLRKENADLRKRLRKISELAAEPGNPADDVDEEIDLVVPGSEATPITEP